MIQLRKNRAISTVRKVCLGFVLVNVFCQYLLHDSLFSADSSFNTPNEGYDMQQLLLDENRDGVILESERNDMRNSSHINLLSESESTHQIKTASTSPSPIEDVKIVAFADREFAEAAKWWYERMTNLTYTTHTLILIDAGAERYFKYENDKREKSSKMTEGQTLLDNNSNPYFRTETWIVQDDGLKPQQRAWTLWKRRIEYCLEQLKKGQSLLLTDVDNIFRRYEPLSQFREGPYDAIYALAQKFPSAIYKKQGFTLCGGMTFLKATRGTIAMMEKILASCGERCDDQIQTNLILQREMEWDFNVTSASKGEDDLVQDGFIGTRLSIPKSNEVGSNYGGSRGGINVVGGSADTDTDEIIFKAKVWDREFAWRGRFATSQCPPLNTNWVAMPGHMPEWLKKKIFEGRRNNMRSKGAEKVVRVKIWEHYCGENGTNLNIERDEHEYEGIEIGLRRIGNPKRLPLELAMARYLKSDR